MQKTEFDARDTEIVAVVVDSVEQNASVAADLGLAYRIGADPALAAITAYGLRHDDAASGLSIARPATFLVDRDGVVRWRDLTENYRRRPHPRSILAAIDQRAGTAQPVP